MRKAHFSRWVGAIGIAVLISGAGVAAGHGLGTIAREGTPAQFEPYPDYGLRQRPAPTPFEPYEDYGLRQRPAPTPFEPYEDYGLRHPQPVP